MKEYHKIKTVFKRNPDDKFKTLLEGEYSLPEFEYLKNNEWLLSEKIDGTNIRVMFDGEQITFGGKTDKACIPAPLVAKLESMFLPKLEQFITIFGSSDATPISHQAFFEVCLYGEGYGAGIQKGGKYRPDQGFVLFDIRVAGWWLQRVDVEDIAAKLKIDVVPSFDVSNLIGMIILAKEGFKSAWGDFVAEGIVARPVVELRARNGSRIITKIKFKDFGGG